jgi:1,2-dihydroxy-3-keto-5-methylthiopentene dioxygenase
MAVVTIAGDPHRLTEQAAITEYLAPHGIEYECWTASGPVAPTASDDEILDAYRPHIEALQRRGGYRKVDVIRCTSDTPGLDAMLARFKTEHWHDEDEVRSIVDGGGLFHVNPGGGPVFVIEVGPGDLIRVPRGTRHWFNLCADRRIRAIRLFQDPAGWTPHYTHSRLDERFEPVCFGPAYLSSARPTAR